MKLPEITFGPVQESSGAIARVGAAQREAIGVMSEGLQAFAREMVRTQAERAKADVEAGMAQDEVELASRRYIPVAALQQELGAEFDALPEGIRAQRQVVKDDQGNDVEVLPTYLVAGTVFQKRAKERVQRASAGISGSGWQAEFQDSARQDVAARQSRLAMTQAHAMLADLKQTQMATVDQYVRGRAWGDALAAIDRSEALEPGEKAQAREQVLAARQRFEEGSRANQLLAEAEERARELEAKFKDDPQGATREAQAIPGELGVKVAQRLRERENERAEAEADAVRNGKGQLELGIRAGRIRSLSELETVQLYRDMPEPVKADLVQVLGSVAEQRLRMSQMLTDRSWGQELERFRGLSDREKLAQADIVLPRVPQAYQGQFMQAVEAARLRLGNAFDTDDVPAMFRQASDQLRFSKQKSAKFIDLGRRWYDAETRRNKGIPPSKEDAEKWVTSRLELGDENGDAWLGGDTQYRFEAEAAAAAAGKPVVFTPYGPADQRYKPAAAAMRGGEAAGLPPPAESPPAAPASKPAPPAKRTAPPAPRKPGDLVDGAELGYPGTEWQVQPNGKLKRVK